MSSTATYQCTSCSKYFSSLGYLKKHRERSCSVLKEETRNRELEDKKLLEQRYDELNTKYFYLQQENAFLRLQIKELELELEKRELKVRLESKAERVEIAEKRIDKYEAHLMAQNEKPRYTNISQYNLAYFDLTPEIALEKAKRYTSEDFQKGPKRTIEFIKENYLTNDDGHPLIVCTDVSRKVLRWKLPDGTPYVDHGGEQLEELLGGSMRATIGEMYKYLWNKLDIKYNEEPTLEQGILERKYRSHKKILQKATFIRKISECMAVSHT